MGALVGFLQLSASLLQTVLHVVVAECYRTGAPFLQFSVVFGLVILPVLLINIASAVTLKCPTFLGPPEGGISKGDYAAHFLQVGLWWRFGRVVYSYESREHRTLTFLFFLQTLLQGLPQLVCQLYFAAGTQYAIGVVICSIVVTAFANVLAAAMAIKYLRSWWNSRKNGMPWASENDQEKLEKSESGIWTTEESSSVGASSGNRSYSVLESVDIDTEVSFMSQSSNENLTSESSFGESHRSNLRQEKDKDVVTFNTEAGTDDSEAQSDTGHDSSSSNSRNTNTTADDGQAISAETEEASRKFQVSTHCHTDLVIPGSELPCFWEDSVESGVQSEMSRSSPSQSSGEGTLWDGTSQNSGGEDLTDSRGELVNTSVIAEILRPCENCCRRLKEATTFAKTDCEEKSRAHRIIGDPRRIRTRTLGITSYGSFAASSEFGTTESYTLTASTSYCYTCTCDTCSSDESCSDTCTMTWPPSSVRASPVCLPSVRAAPDERIASWIEENADHWEKKRRKKSRATTSKAGRFLLKFCTIRRKNRIDEYGTRRPAIPNDFARVNSKTNESVDFFSSKNEYEFHQSAHDGNKTHTLYKGWKKLNRNYRPLIAYERTMFLESYGKNRLTEVGPVEPTTSLQTENNRIMCESDNRDSSAVSSLGFARVRKLAGLKDGDSGRSEITATLHRTSLRERKLMVETTI